MTLEQGLAVAIVVAMVALFVWDRLRYDVVALLALLAAVFTGVVPAEKAFDGFGDPVVIIVGSALVLSAGVGKSGVIGRVIRRLAPYMKTTTSQIVVLAGSVAVLSAFMKNIGALAIFLPIAIEVARRSGTSSARLLMPMSFAALIGGIVTLVGTSPNILVSRVRHEMLGQPFAMFDFAPVGLGILAAGMLFLAAGWRLLRPRRAGRGSAETAFQIARYLTEVRLAPASPLLGKTVEDFEALAEGEASIVAIIREKFRRYIPAKGWTLLPEDVLVIESEPQALRQLVNEAGLVLVGGEQHPAEDAMSEDLGVVEAVVTVGSPLIDCSPRDLQLRERYHVNLLAISRSGKRISARLPRLKFHLGDVVILQGSLDDMPQTLASLGCLPLADRATGIGERPRDVLPLAILAIAMGVVALKLAPVAPAFFAAAVAMMVLGVVTPREAYGAVEWPILVLLACLIPVSDAVGRTGAADLAASGLATVASALPTIGALALVLIAAMAVTPFLNNAATVLIVAPVGAGLATKLGLNPDPFLMAVAIGAACDFLTPIGHQCNTLVMGPGGYRFGDYWRLGLPLSIIVIVVGTPLIALFWPLR